VPPRIASIVDRATRARVTDRYASAREMALAICDVLDDPAR
jgi:hypothetical protein